MSRTPAVIGRPVVALTPHIFLRGVFLAPGAHSDAVLGLPLGRLLLLAAGCLLLPALARYGMYGIGLQYSYPVAWGQMLLYAALLAAGSGGGLPYALALRVVAATTPCLIIGSVPGLHWPVAAWQMWLIVQRLKHYGGLNWRRAALLTVAMHFLAALAAMLALTWLLPVIPEELQSPLLRWLGNGPLGC